MERNFLVWWNLFKIRKYSFKFKGVWNVHLYAMSCKYNHHKYKEHSSENVSIKTVNPIKP